MKQLGSRVPVLQSGLGRISSDSWRKTDATSTERGYGWKWRQARAAYLAKHPLCVMCQAEGRFIEATVVDHVIPHRGDQSLFWDKDNWAALCVHHHSADAQVKDRETKAAL